MSVLRPQLEHAETCSNAEAAREHYACDHAVVCGMKLADPGITTEPRDLPLRNQGRLMFSPPLLSPDAAPPWTCAWTPPLQRQLAENAALAAFDRKLAHCRHEVGELRQQNIHRRPLVWTAGGRTHRAVTSLHRRRKHRIHIALLRRRAAMARAVLPNSSARAVWLFAGIIDRALHHWGHVPALDGGGAWGARP